MQNETTTLRGPASAATEAMLEALRDNPGGFSPSAAAGVAHAALCEIERLWSLMPLRYKDRPPGFVEERKKHCTTPHLCFEFGDAAPVCPPCDRAACDALKEQPHG